MSRLIGQISLFPYDFAPMGWTTCNGAELPIFQNQMLFQLLGTTFGGNGQTSFRIPDFTAIAPKFCHYCISLNKDFTRNRYPGLLGETIPLPTKAEEVDNLVACDGQSVGQANYPQLCDLLYDRFGGGEFTFNLPNLNAKPPATNYRYVICAEGDDPDLPSTRQPMIGELILLPIDQKLQRMLRCDGDKIRVQQQPALYRVIGNTFGGDSQVFQLPDLRSNAPENYNYYIAPNGTSPVRP